MVPGLLGRPFGRLQPSIARAVVAPGALACASAAPARRFNSSAPIVEPLPAAQSPFPFPAVPSAPSSSSQNTNPAPPTLQKAGLVAATPSTAQDTSVAALLPLLAAQPSHYVTLHIHGKPYLVTPGDSIRLPFKMPDVLPGDILRFDRASVIGSRDFTLKGNPWISEGLFECRAVVIGTETEPIRHKIKKKRRERKTKIVKSKHKYTVLRISELKIIAPDTAEASSTS
ncbi:hypothetical protein RB593_004893 [Gaeumannomyces tritici]